MVVVWLACSGTFGSQVHMNLMLVCAVVIELELYGEL